METLDPAARRYAQAAFELAQASGNTAEWAAALDEMAAFMTQPEVSAALENTRASQSAKQQLVETGLRDLPKLPFNLARLLVRKGRTTLAADIATIFRELIEAEQGIAHACARTAVPLTGEELAALSNRLQQTTGKPVVLETQVDPSLIGGVVIQIGDQLIDASTRSRLLALRQSLVGAV